MIALVNHREKQIFVRSVLLKVEWCEDVIEVKYAVDVVQIVCYGKFKSLPMNVSRNVEFES